MKKKILILGAHPDDDVIGCGGFLSKNYKKYKFKVVFLSEGSSCRYKNLTLNKKKISKEINYRQSCAKKALKLFSIKDISFYNNQCGNLHKMSQIKLNQIIEKEINNFKPNIIFNHTDKDLNSDHKTINKSVLVASRPTQAKNKIDVIYSFEILSSTEWNYNNNFKPNYYESLSKKDIKKKWKALSFYKSEIKPKPHSRSFFGVESLSRYRGIQSGNLYAEAFEIIRKFN